MIERALRASGHPRRDATRPRTSCDLEERFAIDGRPVEPAELDRALAVVRGAVDALRFRQHPERAQPTYFEVTTAAAFEIFRRRHVDVAVVEVGLGGRFDATNVVRLPP